VGQFVNGAHEVASAKLQGRSLVGFGHPTRTHLTLADMTGSALVALGPGQQLLGGRLVRKHKPGPRPSTHCPTTLMASAT
jgi:hypothetical protein